MKKIGKISLNLGLALLAAPWILMTILGSLSGSLIKSFKTGYKRGEYAMDKISDNLKAMNEQRNRKSDTKDSK